VNSEVFIAIASVLALVVSLFSLWYSGRSADAAEISAKAALASADAAKDGNFIALEALKLERDAHKKADTQATFERNVTDLRGRLDHRLHGRQNLGALGKELVAGGYKYAEIKEAIQRFWQARSDEQQKAHAGNNPLPVAEWVDRDLRELGANLTAIERRLGGFT
jgi:hypothetical protein